MRFNVLNTYVTPGKYKAKISRVSENEKFGAIYFDVEQDEDTASVPYFVSHDCSTNSFFFKYLKDIDKVPSEGDDLDLFSLLFEEAEITVIDDKDRNKETRSKVVYIKAIKEVAEETPTEEGAAN